VGPHTKESEHKKVEPATVSTKEMESDTWELYLCLCAKGAGNQGKIFPKTPMRIMVNAAEMGVAAEIIDRSKKVRNVLKSRLVSIITVVVSTLLPMKVTYAQFHWTITCTRPLTQR
jgi:hypothetical protein